VILGVALSLTVIFAICGVFIGLYFKVERLCCCCRDNNEEEDQHGDKDYGGNLSIKQMSGVNNLSMIYPNNYSTQQETQKHVKPSKSPRKNFFFSNIPKIKRKWKKSGERSNLVMDQIPIPFSSTTTQVDGQQIIKKTNEQENEVSFSQPSSSIFQYQVYGDAAQNGSKDILY